jgi:hypothetical protein
MRIAEWFTGLLNAVFIITVVSQNSSSHLSLRIRYWGNRTMHSDLAHHIKQSQHNCSHQAVFYKINNWGMGSDFHHFSQALCIALEEHKTVFVTGDWVWNDKYFCGRYATLPPDTNNASFDCYFSREVSPCVPAFYRTIDANNSYSKCPSFVRNKHTRTVFRAASMEYLFAYLNHHIVVDAEKAMGDIFGEQGIPLDMITVHVRWGDKIHSWGDTLLAIEVYVDAVEKLVFRKSIEDPVIFLVSEDPAAVQAFQESELSASD